MKSQLSRITDIVKTGRQVKKILNLIFEKLFEPAATLKNGFWARIPVADHNIPYLQKPL
jgi:hypothetical protein